MQFDTLFILANSKVPVIGQHLIYNTVTRLREAQTTKTLKQKQKAKE